MSRVSRTADAVVVGGGIVGLFTAFHLARLGVRRVAVFEAGRIGAQASSRSGGLVRCHYTSLHEARVAWAALPWWEQWADRIGGTAGFTSTGFLQLVHHSDNELLRSHTAALADAGVQTELLDADAVRDLAPYLRIDDDELAAHEPRSGYAVPTDTLASLAAGCRRLGVMIFEDEPVLELRTGPGDEVTGVRTARGDCAAPVVVAANGAWTTPLLRPLGVEVPITPVRVQVTFLSRPDGLRRGPAGQVTVIDRRFGFYTRPAGEDATLVGLSAGSRVAVPLINPADPAALGPGDGEAFAAPARRAASGRIPGLAGAPRTGGHAGPLDVTPDHRMILGDVPGRPGLFLATGMSGGGFKKAPAVGAAMAELITTGSATTAPIHPFHLSRFTDKALISAAEYSVPANDTDPDRRLPSESTPLIH